MKVGVESLASLVSDAPRLAVEQGAFMPSTTAICERAERDLDAMMLPLQALAGEIRLLIHWANEDCRRTWDFVEPQLLDFEVGLESATDDNAEELRRMGNELHGRLQALREAVRRA